MTDALDEQAILFALRQAEAIARILLLKESEPMTLDDVTAVLAHAEEQARFMCGFVDLHAATTYKKTLQEHLVEWDVVTVGEHETLSLTEKGRRLADTPLPPAIEKYL